MSTVLVAAMCLLGRRGGKIDVADLASLDLDFAGLVELQRPVAPFGANDVGVGSARRQTGRYELAEFAGRRGLQAVDPDGGSRRHVDVQNNVFGGQRGHVCGGRGRRALVGNDWRAKTGDAEAAGAGRVRTGVVSD